MLARDTAAFVSAERLSLAHTSPIYQTHVAVACTQRSLIIMRVNRIALASVCLFVCAMYIRLLFEQDELRQRRNNLDVVVWKRKQSQMSPLDLSKYIQDRTLIVDITDDVTPS